MQLKKGEGGEERAKEDTIDCEGELNSFDSLVFPSGENSRKRENKMTTFYRFIHPFSPSGCRLG